MPSSISTDTCPTSTRTRTFLENLKRRQGLIWSRSSSHRSPNVPQTRFEGRCTHGHGQATQIFATYCRDAGRRRLRFCRWAILRYAAAAMGLWSRRTKSRYGPYITPRGCLLRRGICWRTYSCTPLRNGVPGDGRLGPSLGAFPGQTFVPRHDGWTGALVLSGAQWRLTPGHLWSSAASEVDKARSLGRLRDRLGLPRWVFVSNQSRGGSLPCDLESLRAIHALEHTATRDSMTDIVLEEMVPSPEQFPVSDDGDLGDDRVAAELLLRFPYDESPAEMAVRLAAHWPWPDRDQFHATTTERGR